MIDSSVLPSYRLIGHKEWAPGRKSDPVYAMSWRRARVAAFKPRGSTPPPPPKETDVPLTEADRPLIEKAVRNVLMGVELPAAAVYLPGGEKIEVGPARVYRFLQHAASHSEKAALLGEQIVAELAALRATVGVLATANAENRGATPEQVEVAIEAAILDAGAALRAVARAGLADDEQAGQAAGS